VSAALKSRGSAAVRGHATANPAIPAMKSRRRIAFPKLGTTLHLGFQLRPSKQEFATSDMGRNGQFALRKS
jgi:hypothetical protein